MAGNFKSYAQKDIHDDHFITLVGSMGAVFNAISRPFWSSLVDFIGFKTVYLIMLILQVIFSFTLETVHENKMCFMIWM